MKRWDERVDWAEMCRGLAELEAKWVAKEDQLKAELELLPWWRFLRRSSLKGELQGINKGLLQLIFAQVSARNGIMPSRIWEDA